MDKYIPLVLIILLTLGGYYIERSIFIAGQHWLTYGLGEFVFLLWAVAMLVIVLIYKDLQEVQIISTSTRVVKLTD
jgi:hypothetical protein